MFNSTQRERRLALKKTWALCSCVLLSLAGSSGLLADPIQITGGVGGGISGVCITNCNNSPNLLVSGDIGVYMVSQHSSDTQELLVLLVPNDTTNLFSSDPFDAIEVYNTSPRAFTGVTGSSVLATPANAASFGLGNALYVSGALTSMARESISIADYFELPKESICVI